MRHILRMPVIVEKRNALATYNACPSERNLQALYEPLAANFSRVPGNALTVTGFSFAPR